jgi:superfamily II DNA/RNA helicase
MLDLGFEKAIRDIMTGRDMPGKEDRQTVMFSATFPPKVRTLAQDFLRSYVRISVGKAGNTPNHSDKGSKAGSFSQLHSRKGLKSHSLF